MTSGARRAAAQVLAGLLKTTALVGSSPALATAVSAAAHRASVASWSGGPLVIAHRGASGVAPENTLPGCAPPCGPAPTSSSSTSSARVTAG